jgi:Fe-S-cluster containining protein
MRDPAPLRAFKRVVRLFVALDLALFRQVEKARGRLRFDLAGDCARCAACCEAPPIQVGWITWYLPTLRRLFIAWQRRVNGFELRAIDAQQRVLTFECTHFDRATRRCDSYDSRPTMCRDYPRLLLHHPHPEMLAGCGYRPRARDARRYLDVLDQQAMTEEQRARLKKDLFLE